ncbi:protein arv1 homolog isoform X2 [Durio zibethinus]|uniref:Protein ARV n=1 Tax=Durio zibethinus TaxID=66656 RepID=A0A6P6B0T6_DURZI|nr:protein arv1 homolog isoform X2 [Durio zibethinus]
MEYRCVQCGFLVKSLFVQYSPGNIRLMKCENCKAVADEYIECELMIVLIDLILHKPKAYRHLIYNVLSQQSVHFQGLLWKSLFGFLVMDAYRSLFVKRPEEEWGMSMSIFSFFWIYRKMLVDVILGNFLFLCSFLLAIRNVLKTSARFTRFRDLLLAVLISSYFKIFLAATMVWEFPPSVIYIIDLFVLSSNTVALKVITESTVNRCVGACLIAHAVKFCTTQVFYFIGA